MFGQTAACLVRNWEVAVAGTWSMTRTEGTVFLSIGLGPFSFRSPPMEMQPPVSPQQSECNPVGALQVCLIFVFMCAVSELRAVRQGCVHLWVGWSSFSFKGCSSW